MECAAILELLSEYIDGTVDVQTRTAVEKHIAVCENCKQTLTSLRAVVEELGALDQVKPPADFLEKIHERMEPRSGFNKILRKLFVPYGIKIPLELAAAATVTILVFFVLNIQQPEFRMMQIPTASKSQRLAEKPKADRITPAFKNEAERPAPVFEEAPAKLSNSKPVLLYQKSIGKTARAPIEKEFEASSSMLAKGQVKQKIKKSEAIKLALVLKTGVIGGTYKPGIAMQATPLRESDSSTVEKKSALTDSFERKIDAGEKDHSADLLSSMKHIIDLVKGKILTVEYDRQAEQLKSVYAEIPAKSYESFCKELTNLATFQSPPPDLADKDLETIQVRIRFLSD